MRGVGKESVIALPASGEIVRVPDTQFELEPGSMYAIEVRVLRLEDGAVSEARYQAAVREEEPVVGKSASRERAESADARALGGEAGECVLGVAPAAESAEAAAQRGEARESAPVAASPPAPQTFPQRRLLVQLRGSTWFPSFYVQNKHFRQSQRGQLWLLLGQVALPAALSVSLRRHTYASLRTPVPLILPES